MHGWPHSKPLDNGSFKRTHMWTEFCLYIQVEKSSPNLIRDKREMKWNGQIKRKEYSWIFIGKNDEKSEEGS